MVSVPDSGAIIPGSIAVWGHCVVFLGKILYSHSAALSSPRCIIGYWPHNARGTLGGLAFFKGGVEILDPSRLIVVVISLSISLRAKLLQRLCKNVKSLT